MSFLKNFGIFTFFTLISRIFGMIRDVINARVLGASELSDAFFVAFRLPNLFRGIFAEGAMNSAFIPILNRNFDNKNDSQRFIRKIYSILFISLIFVCILSYIFMPNIINILAPGFSKQNIDYIFNSCVSMARIMFPFLFFISITALFGSILQTNNKFFPTASYPIIMNIVLIIASFVPYFIQNLKPSFSLAYAVTIAGFLQMIFLIICAKIYKINMPSLSLNFFSKNFFDSDIKDFFKKFFPAVLTTCITRISITIDTIFASFVPQAVSFIYYADRLYQMPLSLIGTAISSVILPIFSKELKNNRTEEEILKAQEKILQFALILILPAFLGLCIMSKQICILLFGLNFGDIELSKTSLFLSILSISLPFNVLNNIFNSFFFSHGKTFKITIFALISLFSNIILNIIFFKLISFYSVAIATLISSVINNFLLFYEGKKHKIILLNKNIFKKIKNIIFLNILTFLLLITMLIISSYIQPLNYIYNNMLTIFEILFIIIIYFFILYKRMNYRFSFFKKLFSDI
jgi:putative peptidoglycan lipid II flippase